MSVQNCNTIELIITFDWLMQLKFGNIENVGNLFHLQMNIENFVMYQPIKSYVEINDWTGFCSGTFFDVFDYRILRI